MVTGFYSFPLFIQTRWCAGPYFVLTQNYGLVFLRRVLGTEHWTRYREELDVPSHGILVKKANKQTESTYESDIRKYPQTRCCDFDTFGPTKQISS